MTKTIPEHFDAIGRPLKVGDPVACAYGTTQLLIGRITALGEKQVRVVEWGQPDRSPCKKWVPGNKGTAIPGHYIDSTSVNGKLRYPKEVVLLDGQDITMYLLKHACTKVK